MTTELLLDTHLLLWAAAGVGLPDKVDAMLRDVEVAPVFSAASIWEVAIKAGLGRPDFKADASLLRRGLLDNGYAELPITTAHAAAVAHLPPLHKDPFDRMLVAQAVAEGVILLTADAMVARYPGPIELV
jgi:PIN domain nuclease of toxin-antitoxin system